MPLGEIIPGPNRFGPNTVYLCDHCGYAHASQGMAEECCVFYCDDCGTEHRYQEDAETCCMYVCDNCGSYWETEQRANRCCEEQREQRLRLQQLTEYPHDILEIPVKHVVTIPSIRGRPVRLCSIEQELSAGGPRTAHMLYDLGISPYESVRNYSADIDPGSAIVKADGSLDRQEGGEVLYSRFNLASRSLSGRFSQALACIRELRQRRLVTTSRNAGMHIHISATDVDRNPENIFGPAQMANLYEIFSFCEEVLFRLAAAGWQSHRGSQYTQPIPKDGEMSPGKLAKNAVRGRHFSLNFQRLLNAARGCSCGACAVGDWRECECGMLNTGTIEWRIFNATTKPETVHGWLILAHSLTAKAFDYQLGTLEPNGYQATPSERHAWILGWILSECPMTDAERLIVLSLAKRSPGLRIDWDELEAGLNLNEDVLATSDAQDDEFLYA